MSHTFSITDLTKVPSLNGVSDVVVQAQITCFNTETGVSSVENVGFNCAGVATNTPFTPYTDLTEEQVLSWLDSADMEPILSSIKAATDIPEPAYTPQPDVLPWS